jgi:hypothetical protein
MLGVYDGRGKGRRKLASASDLKCCTVHHVQQLAQFLPQGKLQKLALSVAT